MPPGVSWLYAAADGVEVRGYIGLDTVTLKGVGFTPRVKVGDKVEAGVPLIDFDLDQIATHAKSLLTEIIILNGDAARVVERASGYVKAGTDTLLKLTLVNDAAKRARKKATRVSSEAILVPNPMACTHALRQCWRT